MIDYKIDWWFVMGMLDAFDYMRGRHPEKPDDQTSIESWCDAAILRMDIFKRKRNA